MDLINAVSGQMRYHFQIGIYSCSLQPALSLYQLRLFADVWCDFICSLSFLVRKFQFRRIDSWSESFTPYQNSYRGS